MVEAGEGTDLAGLVQGVLAEEQARQDQEAQQNQSTVLPDDLLPGVGGEAMSFRRVVGVGGLSMIGVLAALNVLDNVDTIAFTVLGPDIQRTLDLSDAGLGAVNGLGGVLLVTAAVPLGFAADRLRRTRLAGVCALIAALFAGLTGAVQAVWQLAVVRLLSGFGKAATGPVHNSLLSDTYPIEGRARVFAAHNLANSVASVLGPLLVGAVAGLAGGTEGWRWAFLVAAVPTAVLGLVALKLKEPTRGAFEQNAVLGDVLGEQSFTISFGSAVERLLQIRTLYFLLVGVGVLGFALFGIPPFFNLLLEREYGLSVFDRGIVGALTSAGGLLGVPLGGVLGERLFRTSPPKAILLVAGCVAGYPLIFVSALYLPGLVPVLIGVTLANALISVAVVPVYSFIAAVVPFRLRALGFALLGIYIFLLGGFMGGLLTGAISDALGPRSALAIVAPPSCLVAAGLVAYGARHVRRDISMVVQELRDEQADVERASQGDVPLLQVRNLDFSYGQVQVLFDVNVEVQRGEVLALLGTNGAGKSTLLRAICGLGVASRGTVRLDGRTITYANAESRVQLGIVQVPGGKAIFPTLSVRENLLAGAYTFGYDTAKVNERTARALELFPKLQERLDQPAGTLSGGEQQMLALAKALLLDPKVLLIDELSLGLAPVVVQEILQIVESLKADGITMVIVEQSLNVALSIADRAIFMEKGQVRFQGPAQELLERDDLVRAVFLGKDGG